MIDEIYERKLPGEIDLDEIMVNGTHARKLQGVDHTQLSKIWIIYLDNSKITLDVTTYM